jgi:hypothetical protein
MVNNSTNFNKKNNHISHWGRRSRDRMVVGITTTYAISDVVSSSLDHGEVYNIRW